MLALSAVVDDDQYCDFWFARVPSLSNPADNPSRLLFEGFPALAEATRFELSKSFWLDFERRLRDLESECGW